MDLALNVVFQFLLESIRIRNFQNHKFFVFGAQRNEKQLQSFPVECSEKAKLTQSLKN